MATVVGAAADAEVTTPLTAEPAGGATMPHASSDQTLRAGDVIARALFLLADLVNLDPKSNEWKLAREDARWLLNNVANELERLANGERTPDV